jgi:DNA-binding MarR family transcriptional regulator
LGKLSPAKQKAFLAELKESGRRPRRSRSQKPRTLTLPAEPQALAEKLLARLDAKEAAQVVKLLSAGLTKGK